MTPLETTIYADGSKVHLDHWSAIGWGLVIVAGDRVIGTESGRILGSTDSHLAEFEALFAAIQSAGTYHAMRIVSDAKSIVETAQRIQNNGLSAREDHLDRWLTCIAAPHFHDITFTWQKSHTGDQHHEMADRLARRACRPERLANSVRGRETFTSF